MSPPKFNFMIIIQYFKIKGERLLNQGGIQYAQKAT